MPPPSQLGAGHPRLRTGGEPTTEILHLHHRGDSTALAVRTRSPGGAASDVPGERRLAILCWVLPRPVQAAPAGGLGDAVVIVVGGRGIGEDGDEAVLGGMGAAGRRDVSVDQDPAVVVAVAGVVEILVELVAVHLPQELGLAQLVQGVKAVGVGRRGELAQVGMEAGGVQRGEGRCVVAGRRRRRKRRAAGGRGDHAGGRLRHGAEGVMVAREGAARVLRGVGGSGEVGAVMLIGAGRGEEALLGVYGVQRRHLWRGGQPVGVGVHAGAAAAARGLSVSPDGRQPRARRVLTRPLFLPPSPAAGPLLRHRVLVPRQAAQQKPGIHPLADPLDLLLPPRPVFVVGIILHVLHPQPLGLLHVGTLL